MNKTLVNILLIVLVLVIAAESILWLRSRTQSMVESQPTPTAVMTKVTPQAGAVSTASPAPPPPFIFNSVTRIESYGILTEVIEPGKKYLLKLDSGDNITVVLNDKTVIGQAVYTSNDDNEVSVMTYNPIPADDLNTVAPSRRVDIIYIKDKVNPDNTILVEKFVLLD